MMDFAVVTALVLCALTVPGFGDTGSGKAQSCSDIRQFYNGNGFSLKGVPQSEISGEHLRICPQGYTCCTSVMEDSLSNLSRTEMQGLIRDAGRALQASLNGQYKAFDDYLLELLNSSEVLLQESYPPVLGFLYTQNTRVFSDLYTELRRYYRGSNINVEEALNEFWARLLERLFKGANGQYLIGDDYLECVSKQSETLRPFGDTPRNLKLKVTRTFVAARSFVQGLVISGEVVRKVSQVPLSPECVRAIMKMTYCRHCRGVPSAKPCANYCANVLKGCLANHADLDTEWRNLADAMLQVANKFEGASSVNVVFLSLPKHISEAITTMIENIDTFNTKVFQACGNLREEGTSNIGLEEVKKRGKATVQDSLISGARPEKLVSDVSRRLRDMQSYWVSLPSTLCSDRVATRGQGDDKCWNGMARARYLPEVMGDGLASQINNPEVEIDITKPDMTIRQQIMQLKIMTNRLRNAFNGNDVDFQDTSDDVSGSGSGMCADDNCARGPRLMAPNTDRPKLYAYPPENKKVVKASANHNLPFIALYLLSLVTLLLRR
ncbi:glypican-1-like [Salvelinus fontinalis]|uniref:glypican-1-like n=1 Tax=Salvelinus fontinalis TaxID=8038 RepID=UPI002486116E|nr:glypican-1-like [Salvelinus fontinalis]